MLFIGDVHGKFRAYREIIRDVPASIQVGDMGVGFINPATDRPTENPPYDAMVQGNHRFIRGNHDNPGVCRKHSQWIKDGAVEGDIMFIGGAYSIDKDYRTPNYTWWADEELSDDEFDLMVPIALAAQPKIMVTHDCPTEVCAQMYASHHRFDDSRTEIGLQKVFEAHQPDLWIYGHHHISFDQIINGTRFICLPELATIEV